jgi:hypothetical protein
MAEESIFGNVIFSYARQQALEDGVLISLFEGDGEEMSRSLGFKVHIAITASAYERTIGSADRELPPGQDRNGRLWDVLWMLRVAIKGAPANTDTVLFQLWVAQKEQEGTKTQLVPLKAVFGPGDEGEPVITIMFPEED